MVIENEGPVEKENEMVIETAKPGASTKKPAKTPRATGKQKGKNVSFEPKPEEAEVVVEPVVGNDDLQKDEEGSLDSVDLLSGKDDVVEEKSVAAVESTKTPITEKAETLSISTPAGRRSGRSAAQKASAKTKESYDADNEADKPVESVDDISAHKPQTSEGKTETDGMQAEEDGDSMIADVPTTSGKKTPRATYSRRGRGSANSSTRKSLATSSPLKPAVDADTDADANAMEIAHDDVTSAQTPPPKGKVIEKSSDATPAEIPASAVPAHMKVSGQDTSQVQEASKPPVLARSSKKTLGARRKLP
ncbi:hypothetical protein HDU76_011844, partial [Blyttiomyces sp. JEL0837]